MMIEFRIEVGLLLNFVTKAEFTSSFWRSRTQEQIAEVVGKDRSVISRIVQNTKFGEMHNFLEQGKDMAWIADHYHIDSREIDIAEKLGVIEQTINSWTSGIRARQRANRNITIIRLRRLGWTREKISEAVEMSKGRVAQITNNTIFGNIDNLLSQGHDMDVGVHRFRVHRSACDELSRVGLLFSPVESPSALSPPA